MSYLFIIHDPASDNYIDESSYRFYSSCTRRNFTSNNAGFNLLWQPIRSCNVSFFTFTCYLRPFITTVAWYCYDINLLIIVSVLRYFKLLFLKSKKYQRDLINVKSIHLSTFIKKNSPDQTLSSRPNIKHCHHVYCLSILPTNFLNFLIEENILY
jgi:hypothetical protein